MSRICYEDDPQDVQDRRAERQAGAYRPERDAEAEAIKALGERATPRARMAAGYHQTAKAAAGRLEQKETTA